MSVARLASATIRWTCAGRLGRTTTAILTSFDGLPTG